MAKFFEIICVECCLESSSETFGWYFRGPGCSTYSNVDALKLAIVSEVIDQGDQVGKIMPQQVSGETCMKTNWEFCMDMGGDIMSDLLPKRWMDLKFYIPKCEATRCKWWLRV